MFTFMLRVGRDVTGREGGRLENRMDFSRWKKGREDVCFRMLFGIEKGILPLVAFAASRSISLFLLDGANASRGQYMDMHSGVQLMGCDRWWMDG